MAQPPEGEHAAVWDGRDDAGTRSPAGTYFARLKADGHARAQKLSLQN